MEQLLKYINNHSPHGISESDFETVKSYFTHKRLRKKQYFLQAGDVCKYFGFILKGSMRQYIVDDKGAEHTVQMGIENWWVGDRESYTMHTPSQYNIEALEDTEMLIISRKDVLQLIEHCPAFVETLKLLDDRNNIANQRRITSAISDSAEKRYTDFIGNYPDLFARFPQHMIASYLGITKDTLSRIKRRILYNE